MQESFDEYCRPNIRIEFSEAMLSWKEERPNFFKNMLWSDEAVFHVEDLLIRHKSHCWALEKPGVSFFLKRMQTRP